MMQLINRVLGLAEAVDNIQAPFGRQLFALFGNQTHIMRFYFAGNIKHFRGHCALKVHACQQNLANCVYISILDMAPVFAQV